MLNDDWRLTDQEDYLKGLNLKHIKYKAFSDKWDHDHCEYCSDKFTEGVLGYCTTDEYYWICEICFNDFKDSFKWIVAD